MLINHTYIALALAIAILYHSIGSWIVSNAGSKECIYVCTEDVAIALKLM